MRSLVFREIVAWGSMPIVAVLIGILIWRKAYRGFPYFFNYMIVGEAVGVIRLCFFGRYSRTYFYTYWATDLLIAIAALLATYELFVRRLFPRFHSVRFYRLLFPVAGVVVVLLGVPAALQLNGLWIIIRAIHVFAVLRAAVLVFFVALMIFMGRHWGRYEFGIGLGLGIEAAAQLLASASWTQAVFIRWLTTLLPVMAYDVACVIWLVTFSGPEKAKSTSGEPISGDLVREARKWEQTLKESLTQKKHSD